MSEGSGCVDRERRPNLDKMLFAVLNIILYRKKINHSLHPVEAQDGLFQSVVWDS